MSNAKVTALGFAFDATQVAPQAAMEAVPSGWYSVVITDGEIKPNDGGNGRRLAIEWTVTEGQYKGRKIFDGLNVVHSSEQAQSIAQAQLSAICHAVSVFQLQDVSQLFQKPHQIKVDVDPKRTVDADGNDRDSAGNLYAEGTVNTKTYEAKNRFKGVKAGSAPAAVATNAPGAPAPSWAAKPGAAPAAATPAPAWAAGTAGNAPAGASQVAPATPAAPAATAPAPAAPAAASPGKPKGKPKGKPGAAAAAVAPKVERKFFVGIDSPEFGEPLPESKVVEYFGKGMPSDTPLCLEGEEAYKTAAEYGIGVTVAAAPVTPAPVAAPAGGLPPWAK